MSYRVIFKDDELYHHGVLGMKWGVRRYQNEDGTLTDLGKQRLDYEVHRQLNKDPSKLAGMTAQQRSDYESNLKAVMKDPQKWVTADMKSDKKAIEDASTIVKKLQQYEQSTRPTAKPKKRMDLSKMTDQEMRAKINREQLEIQYNDLFNKVDPVRISKGRERVQNILAVAGASLGVVSTGLGIALAIKELKND